MFKVIIVENDIMARRLLEIFINKSEQYHLIQSGGKLLLKEDSCYMNQVDLIILDACTAMEQGGIEIVKKIKQMNSTIKVVMITNQPEYSFMERAYNVGVDSFWYKRERAEEIMIVMDQTMKGEKIYPDQTPVVQIGNACSLDFSKRELEVLREIIAGKTDAVIAEKLNISIRTVKGHVQSIKEKTGLRNRTEIAVRTRESGFIIN